MKGSKPFVAPFLVSNLRVRQQVDTVFDDRVGPDISAQLKESSRVLAIEVDQNQLGLFTMETVASDGPKSALVVHD
jgi:hypothetical protein